MKNFYFVVENKIKFLPLCFKEQKIDTVMFDFQQYLGFLLFLTIFTMGFWLLLFLAGFAFYWITGTSIELYKERKAKKRAEQQ